MTKDRILNGIHIGEHSFDPARIIEEIEERCVKPGLNFVTIRTGYKRGRFPIPQHYFLEWAEYLAAHKIYFLFLYTVQYAPEGRDSVLDKETVSKMKEIAGEYFLGDMIGEVGSSLACKLEGYFAARARKDNTPIKTDYPDMAAAHAGYVEQVSKYIAIDNGLGIPAIASVEATGLNKYNAEAGVHMPMLEMMCGNPDILVSSLRGTARATSAALWGTYIAHEWYGGMRHDDILKRKRLELTYKYAYLAGTQLLCLESGDECLCSYGYEHPVDSPLCQDYRDILVNMMDWIRNDTRPTGGPKTSLSFISGRHDAWGGWGGSALWNQFGRPEWGHGEAEYSWRILEELGSRRSWTDIANYGQRDLSAAPGYGMYDIIPIEADLEVLCRYDRLIFLGWNSMEPEDIPKLTEYVRRGGRLLLTAAHLNTATSRNGSFQPPAEELLEPLFGCSFTGKTRFTNDGIKFTAAAPDPASLYPGTLDKCCDPIYSAGYLNWGEFRLTTGIAVGELADSFAPYPGIPAVIQNSLGSGFATLVTSLHYPGAGALQPLYRALVRAAVTESAKSCPVQILGSDRLRWACYEGGRLYLLNTDYDLPITVQVIAGSTRQQLTLEPLELKVTEVSL